MSALVAMPSASTELDTAAALVTREAMSEALAKGAEASAQLADNIGQLFQHWTAVEGSIKANKSLTGAYVHRASRDANGGTVDAEKVNARLGVQTSTRYGYIARLYFDFDFDPSDPANWTAAIKGADKHPAFRALLNKVPAEGEAAVTKQNLLDWLALPAADKAKDDKAAKSDTVGRKAQPPTGAPKSDPNGEPSGAPRQMSNAARNAAIMRLAGEFHAGEVSEKDATDFILAIEAMKTVASYFPKDILTAAIAAAKKDDTATPAAMPKRGTRKAAASATSAK